MCAKSADYELRAVTAGFPLTEMTVFARGHSGYGLDKRKKKEFAHIYIFKLLSE